MMRSTRTARTVARDGRAGKKKKGSDVRSPAFLHSLSCALVLRWRRRKTCERIDSFPCCTHTVLHWIRRRVLLNANQSLLLFPSEVLFIFPLFLASNRSIDRPSCSIFSPSHSSNSCLTLGIMIHQHWFPFTVGIPSVDTSVQIWNFIIYWPKSQKEYYRRWPGILNKADGW